MSVPPPTSIALAAADLERLRTGAAELGVALDATALSRFGAYAELLDRWKHTTSLVSCNDAGDLVDRHFLDSLACAWPCGAARSIADLGSGAGFPGVPLAIVDPHRRVVLVEARRRRVSFLRELRRVLALERLDVRELRAEELSPASEIEAVDVVVCRAVWPDERVASIARHWLRDGGMLLSLRSEGQRNSAHVRRDAPLVFEQVLSYRIGAGRRRRLDVYRKTLGRSDVSRET